MKRVLACAVFVLLVSAMANPTLAQSNASQEWSTQSRIEKSTGKEVWIAFVKNHDEDVIFGFIRDRNTSLLLLFLSPPQRLSRVGPALKIDNNPPINMTSWPFKFSLDGISIMVQLEPTQELRVLSEIRRGRRVRVRYRDASEKTIEASFTLKGSAVALRVVEKDAE